MSQAGTSDEALASSAPSVDDLLKDIGPAAEDEPRSSQDRFEERFRIRSVEGELKYVHLKGLIEHYRHKGFWSGWLLFLVVGLMLFQSILIVFVGLNKLDYSSYQWLLPALLVQNL